MAAVPSVAFPFKGSDTNSYSGQTVPLDASGNVPVSFLSQPLPSGASTSALQTSGNTTLASILSTLQAQRSESLWTDDTGSFFVRVEIGGVLSWTDLNGNTISGPGTGARPAAGSTVLLSRSSYQAIASGTGYSNGDYLDHFVTTDPSSGAVLGNFWIDISAGVRLATAPASANVSPIAPLPTGAATNAALLALAALLPVSLGQKAAAAALAVVLDSALETAPGTAGTSALTIQGNAAGIPMPIDTVVKFTPASRSSTIAAGGTAQSLMVTNTSRRGYKIQNQSSSALYVNELATATLDQNSFLLNPGDYYESLEHNVSTGAVSIIGATTGQAFYAREF